MKRFIYGLLSVLLSVSIAMLLGGCGSVSTADGSAQRKVIISEEKIDEELRWFLGIDADHEFGNMGDRTYTSQSEYDAAKKICDRFKDDEAFTVTSLEDTEFDVTFTTAATLTSPATQTTRKSQNVEIKFSCDAATASGKQLIIGTGYGNNYGDYNTNSHGTPDYVGASTGAFDNATGVATVLAIMDYFSEHASDMRRLDFDVTFVFFGCTEYNSIGASSYVESMTPAERLNTAAMINISRLGGERAYIYANDYKTDREDLLRQQAAKGGYEFYSIPKNMPIIEAEYIQGVSYTHYAMLGDHAVFTEWGINSVVIRSGYYGGFNLANIECSGEKNRAGTATDTYANLVKTRPNYAKQGSDAASLLVSSFTHTAFIAAMGASDSDYSFWLQPLWAQLILLGVIILLGVLVVVIVAVFEKKYPFVPKTKKMKIAVFGPEYETKNEDEIIIDVKPKDNNNPFDI